jgi:membrane protease subunit (stomatin/prohibitin family)
MSEIVAFTDNIRDLSNENGYQFEFVCERCGNGYRAPFQRNIKETGRGLLRAASSLFGGKLSQLSGAAEQVAYDRGTNSPEKDKAMRDSVEAVKDRFKQCRGCGNWVCVDVCWNTDVGQCLQCSPSVGEEVARAQASAQRDQIWEKAKTVDWTEDVDIATRATVTCQHCNAKVEGGKFCPECGQKLEQSSFCTNCGAEMDEGAKFCGECGTKAGG